MAPDLPAPHGFFTVMAILGTPGVRIFANEQAIGTSARDTAYVVSGTGAYGPEAFGTFSLGAECAIAADGGHVSLGPGAEVVLDGRPPRVGVRRAHPREPVTLELEATGAITRFVEVPRVYRHWSLLCRYTGRVGAAGMPVSGLCTYEYAAGVGTATFLPEPLRRRLQLLGRSFTYQVLSVDEHTQVLLGFVRGPRGAPILRGCHVRRVDGGTSVTYGDCSFEVLAHEPSVRRGPTGEPMRLPREFAWRVGDGAGTLLELRGHPDGNWLYGLGCGYVGSFAYEGRFAGVPIGGRGYVEYIDCL
jgi:hypothetical protein